MNIFLALFPFHVDVADILNGCYASHPMTPRLWAALLIFFSGYSPLGLMLAVRDFDFAKRSFGNPAVATVLLAAAALSVVLLLATLRVIKSGTPITIREARSKSPELMNYALPYIVSFLQIDLGKPQDMLPLAIFLALMFVLAYRTKCLFINPVLVLIGYQLYSVQYDDHGHGKERDVLVRGSLRAGDECIAESISPHLLLITSNHVLPRKNPAKPGDDAEKPEEEEAGPGDHHALAGA